MDESDSEEDNNVVQNSVAILYSDAINAANMWIKWSEQNADFTAKQTKLNLFRFDKHGSKPIGRYDDGNVRSFPALAIKIFCEIFHEVG